MRKLFPILALLLLPSLCRADAVTLTQSSTARKIVFLMVKSSDHISGDTGDTVTVTLSKNGAAFAAPVGTVAELANGWYVLTPTAADTGTLGVLIVHATATNADPTDAAFNVVAYNADDSTRLGLSALPSAAAGASGGLPTGDASGRVLLQPSQPGVTIPTVTTLTTAPTGVTLATGQNVATVGGQAPPANWNLASIDGAGKVTFNNTSLSGSVGSVTGAVGSVTGSVGSISGITFPSNFGTFSIDTSGRVTLVPGQSTTASNFVAAPTAAQVAAAILTTPANTLATDASGRVLLQPTQTGVTIPTVTSVTGGVTVTTNSDKTGYTATASNLPTDYLSSGEQAYLAKLDATISSRMATFTYTAPLNADTSGVTTLLSRLPQSILFDGSGNVKSNAQAIAAGAGGDPWATALPASYAAGTAGSLLTSAGTFAAGRLAAIGTSPTVAQTQAALTAQGTQTVTIPAGRKGLTVPLIVNFGDVTYTIPLNTPTVVPQTIYEILHNGGYVP